jgi:hypothetical protein
LQTFLPYLFLRSFHFFVPSFSLFLPLFDFSWFIFYSFLYFFPLFLTGWLSYVKTHEQQSIQKHRTRSTYWSTLTEVRYWRWKNAHNIHVPNSNPWLQNQNGRVGVWSLWVPVGVFSCFNFSPCIWRA